MTALETMMVNPFAGNNCQNQDNPYNPRSQRVEEVKSDYMDEALLQALKAYDPQNLRPLEDKFALAASQLDMLIQLLIKKHRREDVEYQATGRWLSGIMRQSYDKLKEREFTFTTGDYAIDQLPNNNNCEEYTGLSIRIMGRAGSLAGRSLNRCSLYVSGDADDYLGHKAEHSVIIADGDVGKSCGQSSDYCNITIKGNAGTSLGTQAFDTVITVYGDIEDDVFFSGKRNLFRTPTQSAFDKALENVMKNEENRVQLIRRSDAKVLRTVTL